jgi:hypothetical protein
MKLPQFLIPLRQSPKPPPATIKRPRRTLGTWGEKVNEQVDSLFLSLLPAEIRNQIYSYVFTTYHSQLSEEDITRVETANTHPHPLALLLTCRKVNLETSLLAFSIHTFLVHGDWSIHALRQRTSILPEPHFNAITSVSFTPHAIIVRKGDGRSHAEFLANIILLLPNLSSIFVRMKKDAAREGAGVLEARWFWSAFDVMGSRWKSLVCGWENDADAWTWRFLDGNTARNTYLTPSREYRLIRPAAITTRFQESDVVVQNCAALLKQKGTEKEVRVYMLLVDGKALGETGRLGPYLVPGVEGVGVEELTTKSGAVGYRYDPGEMYWGDLKNRIMLKDKGKIDRGRDEEVPKVV